MIITIEYNKKIKNTIENIIENIKINEYFTMFLPVHVSIFV